MRFLAFLRFSLGFDFKIEMRKNRKTFKNRYFFDNLEFFCIISNDFNEINQNTKNVGSGTLQADQRVTHP